ncbi:MAG: ParB/RepB/Spo0J family partition protein [Roseomonas sp.]|nr:ParB/RepB/Spo0J family partition protein [Roseomonas sp.]
MNAPPVRSERIYPIPLNLVRADNRLRPVNQARVDEIKASWALVGQISPIEVSAPDAAGIHDLTAGAHRLDAARQMGLATIDALIVDLDPDHRRLREIDENLFRAELNPFDQANFIAERKAIFDRMNPETRGGDRRGGSKTAVTAVLPKGRSFAAETARQIGLSERAVFVALGRFRSLSPAARERLRGTAIAENGAELDALCKRTEAQQAVILDMVLPKDGEPKATSIREAWRVLSGRTGPSVEVDEEAQLKRLQAAFTAATPEVKRQFLTWAKKALKDGVA